MASDADTRVALEAVNTSLTLKVRVSEIQIFFFDAVSALLTIDVNRTKTQLEEANSTTIKVR